LMILILLRRRWYSPPCHCFALITPLLSLAISFSRFRLPLRRHDYITIDWLSLFIDCHSLRHYFRHYLLLMPLLDDASFSLFITFDFDAWFSDIFATFHCQFSPIFSFVFDFRDTIVFVSLPHTITLFLLNFHCHIFIMFTFAAHYYAIFARFRDIFFHFFRLLIISIFSLFAAFTLSHGFTQITGLLRHCHFRFSFIASSLLRHAAFILASILMPLFTFSLLH
jgi:hypothetical protein